jgi:fused signal recognition particle receptor
MFWKKKDKDKKQSPEKQVETPVEETPVSAEPVAEPEPKPAPIEEAPEEKQGWLTRMSSGLSKSTNKITQGLADFVTKRKLDDEALEELEEMLISADLGPHTAAAIIAEFSKTRFGKEADDTEIRTALAEIMADMLAPVAKPLQITNESPYVLLVCGVNGAGKTTTIGKIADKLIKQDGHKVMIAAGDTFRAAAVEQLHEWANRSGALFHAKETNADAASVAYEAYIKAKEQGADVLIIDTAGRLQNKKGLMEELQKIIRVLQKQDEKIPHATLLVLDATTGQNAFSQVEIFKEMMNITGLIVTKLDGSAKGGILVGLANQFGLPVHAIGVGETIADLQTFEAQDYANSLMGL